MENVRRMLFVENRKSKSEKAGLVMSVARIERNLREGGYVKRTRTTGAVYIAAVLEYLCAEVLELAGNEATQHKRKIITPRHIMMAIKGDAELYELMKDVHIREAGVKPFIHPALLPKKKKSSLPPDEEKSLLTNEPVENVADTLSECLRKMQIMLEQRR